MKILAVPIKHNNPLGLPHNSPIALAFRPQPTLFLPLVMLYRFLSSLNSWIRCRFSSLNS